MFAHCGFKRSRRRKHRQGLLKEFGHKRSRELNRATPDDDSSTPEAAQGQPVLHSEFQARMATEGNLVSDINSSSSNSNSWSRETGGRRLGDR